MKFGLRPKEGGQTFDDILAQVQLAEECGFNSVWFAEHYSTDEQWWPSPLVNLAALATQTSDIYLGTNILIAPFYNPVWLASTVAMVDVISDGRVICGLGVGYDEAEFEAFDVSLDDRVGRTIENIILLKRLWTQESVTFDGKYFSLDEFGITPKPVQDPRPDIWLGVWGDYLISQAAKRADAWIPGAVANISELADRNAGYVETLKDEGRTPTTRPLLRDVIVADTDEEAMARAKGLLHEKYMIYKGRNHPFFADYSEDTFESFVKDRVIIGSVSSCVEQIERFQNELGIDYLMVRFPGMSQEEILDSIRTVSDRVFPHFED